MYYAARSFAEHVLKKCFIVFVLPRQIKPKAHYDIVFFPEPGLNNLPEIAAQHNYCPPRKKGAANRDATCNHLILLGLLLTAGLITIAAKGAQK